MTRSKKLERCVRQVKRTVKPRRGQSKTSAAFAICQSSLRKKRRKT